MEPCYKSITFLTLLHFVFFVNPIAVSSPPENSSNVTLGSLGKKIIRANLQGDRTGKQH